VGGGRKIIDDPFNSSSGAPAPPQSALNSGPETAMRCGHSCLFDEHYTLGAMNFIASPALGNLQWVSGFPGVAPAYAGTLHSSPETIGLPPFISFSTSCRRRSSIKRRTDSLTRRFKMTRRVFRIRPL
jgi:hypothetical protein